MSKPAAHAAVVAAVIFDRMVRDHESRLECGYAHPWAKLTPLLLLAGYADTQRGPQRRTLPGPYWFFSNSAAGRARFRQFSERAVAGTERQPAGPGAAALTTKRVVGTARSTAEPTPGMAQGTSPHFSPDRQYETSGRAGISSGCHVIKPSQQCIFSLRNSILIVAPTTQTQA